MTHKEISHDYQQQKISKTIQGGLKNLHVGPKQWEAIEDCKAEKW